MNTTSTPPDAAETPAGPAAEGPLLLSCVLAWIGLSISTLLMQRHAGLPTLFCPKNGGCEEVLTSKYGVLMGVPLPTIGVGLYAILLLLLLCAYAVSGVKTRERLVGAVVLIAVIGVSFSAVLMFIQFRVLHAFCPLCTGSAVTVTLLAIAAAVAEKRGTKCSFPGRAGAALAMGILAFAPAAVQLRSLVTPQREVVAAVDGAEFTRAQMEEDLRAAFQPMRQSMYELEFEWVRKKVDGVLLASEAAKTNADPEQMLAARVAAAAEPSESEVNADLAAHGLLPSPENLNQAKTTLQAAAREQVRASFLEEIAASHQIEVFLEPPKPAFLKIDLKTAKVSGPINAKVQLVVFSDFECHFCRDLSAVLNQARHDFPNEVMVAYRYFPIESHPRAFPAAVAAECAAEQGAFWEFHDKLFDSSGDLSEARLESIAKEIKLDATKFSECRTSGRAGKVVEASRADAIANGLAGAPALFLNGKMIGGMVPYPQLAASIRQEIQAERETPNPSTETVK